MVFIDPILPNLDRMVPLVNNNLTQQISELENDRIQTIRFIFHTTCTSLQFEGRPDPRQILSPIAWRALDPKPV